jgi:hypothetical protein
MESLHLYYSRDGYDLQYERKLLPMLGFPRGAWDNQPNDPDIFEITRLENAFHDLVNRRNSSLNEQSRYLKKVIDSAHFFFDRLKELNPSSILNTSPDMFQRKDFKSRYDAFNEHTVLQERIRKAEIYRNTVRAKLETLLSTKFGTFQGVKGGYGDTLLYRVQVYRESPIWSTPTPTPSLQPSAGERFDLGLRCSGWEAFGEITNEAIISHMNGDKVKNHMNGNEEGTPMISASESPGRLMKFLDKPLARGDEHATVIEVISLRMLQHIGVPQARSTDFCAGRGIQMVSGHSQEGCARFTTHTHWVILHWIPNEAIVATLTVKDFLDLARYRGVIGGEK